MNDEVRYAWTHDSINEIERDSENREKFTEKEAKKIAGLCAKLREVITAAQERVKS